MADGVTTFQEAVSASVVKELGPGVTVRFKGAPIKSFIKAGAFGPQTFFSRRLDVNADPEGQAWLLIEGYLKNVATKEAAANG